MSFKTQRPYSNDSSNPAERIMANKFTRLFKYKNWNLKAKLLTITILLLLGSVLAVSSLSYYKYTQNFQKQSADNVQQTIVQLSYNIQFYLDELFQLSNEPYYNDTLMAQLEQGKPDTALGQYEKTQSVEKVLNDMIVNPRKDILSVYILSDTIYRGGVYSASVDYNAGYKSYDWYQKALATDSAVFVPTHLEEMISNPKYKVFSIVKRINSLSGSGRVLGVIKVDADYSVIESICGKIKTGEAGALFIADGNDAVIYSSAKGKSLDTVYGEVKAHKSPFITTYNGAKYLVNFTQIPSANWTVVEMNSLNELNRGAAATRNATFLLAFACALLAIIILLIFTQSFLKPLMKIVRLMKEVQNGNLRVEFPGQRSDEIGYLGSSFNSMVSRINGMMEENVKLVTEVYEAKLLQSEAQMSALQSQIRPHFIHNTLNMISLMMQCGRNGEAIDNINKLSDLMRGMTNFDKDIPLEKEISLLDSYLGIQSSRYGGRLEYDIEVDNSLYSYVVPALTFQPIVENSVIHGCEKRKEPTHIRITSQAQDDFLVFLVEDDAGGIGAEKLARLREKLSGAGNGTAQPEPDASGRSGGIGLVNVNRRLKIRFGECYGLEVESAEGRGTRVTIRLPKPAGKGENGNV
jgi:two-component system sensor histidine kinase YesM